MTYPQLKTIIDNFKGKNLAFEIFRHSLKPQQKKIFDVIPIGREHALSCREISEKTGIEAHNVSCYLQEIQLKFGELQAVKVNKRIRYFI